MSVKKNNYLKPNKQEKELGKWLQSLFKFDTEVSYYIYDYGKRNCTITIEASGEEYPFVHSSTDDYGRGPNSSIVAQFARYQLKKEYRWYSSFNGFMIPVYDDLIRLRENYKKP